jgi:MOSC domain-containing protein YiiM
MNIPAALQPPRTAWVVSVNAGQARALLCGQRTLASAIGKRSVSGPATAALSTTPQGHPWPSVAIHRLGLTQDEQVDLSVHGGLDKAIYAFPSEHYPAWAARQRTEQARHAQQPGLFDTSLPWGFMGENLSLCGLTETDVHVGDTLHFDSGCVLRVTQPREPCHKFVAIMGYPQAARDMVVAGHCGWYLAVNVPGEVRAGMQATLRPGPGGPTIAESIQAKRRKNSV